MAWDAAQTAGVSQRSDKRIMESGLRVSMQIDIPSSAAGSEMRFVGLVTLCLDLVETSHQPSGPGHQHPDFHLPRAYFSWSSSYFSLIPLLGTLMPTHLAFERLLACCLSK